MAEISQALARLGALSALSALAEIAVSGSKLKGGLRLIAALLAMDVILSLAQAFGQALVAGIGL